MQELGRNFSFPQVLLDDAVAFPNGHFVEMDNMLFEQNGLGRKIAQTQLVRIGGRDVSVSGGSAAAYELVVAAERPADLGSFEAIIGEHKEMFVALHKAFGGSTESYRPVDMVTAIRAATIAGVAASDADRVGRIAAEARIKVQRGAWMTRSTTNRIAAFAKAPLDWRAVDLEGAAASPR